MQEKMRVGVLGATGAVGQRFVELLADHPWFELTALTASDASAGRRYGDACRWLLSSDMPPNMTDMPVRETSPTIECDLVFSALPGGLAGPVEEEFAAAGYGVFSNASAHRQDPDVPLLIPEVNPDHLSLIATQRARRGWERGFIITNPNCSAVMLTMALAPLQDVFGVRSVVVNTMQGLSGAGYPGVPSLDALDNVIPFIGGEEVHVGAGTRERSRGLEVVPGPGDAPVVVCGVTVIASVRRGITVVSIVPAAAAAPRRRRARRAPLRGRLDPGDYGTLNARVRTIPNGYRVPGTPAPRLERTRCGGFARVHTNQRGRANIDDREPYRGCSRP